MLSALFPAACMSLAGNSFVLGVLLAQVWGIVSSRTQLLCSLPLSAALRRASNPAGCAWLSEAICVHCYHPSKVPCHAMHAHQDL